MLKERRKYKRYAVEMDEIQALIYPGPEFFRIKDIGKGGLALEYTPIPGETVQSRILDIISISCAPFFLKGIACRTAYDIETLMEGQSFTGRSRRMRGLTFVTMTRAQEARLDALIGRCFEGPPGNAGDRGADANG